MLGGSDKGLISDFQNVTLQPGVLKAYFILGSGNRLLFKIDAVMFTDGVPIFRVGITESSRLSFHPPQTFC